MKEYLLDTHVLLWAGVGSERLSATTREILDDRDVTVHFSVVNIWETVIKSRLGRPDFKVDPVALRAHAKLVGMPELPVLAEHVLGVLELPSLHQDPFDRLLIAQARQENLTLLTVDQNVLDYGQHVQPA